MLLAIVLSEGRKRLCFVGRIRFPNDSKIYIAAQVTQLSTEFRDWKI